MRHSFTNIYQKLRPLLFLGDPEKMHTKMLTIIERLSNYPLFFSFLNYLYKKEYNILKTDFFEKSLNNPIGLAAGFDKDGRIFNVLFGIGFGFIEIGTVTPKGQLGNIKPRLFRLVKDKAIINHLGFNNLGAVQISKNLKTVKNRIDISCLKEKKNNFDSAILGINIGKNKSTPIDRASEDYVSALKILYPYADYFTLNISSPNTENLIKLQKRNLLENLLEQVCECRSNLDKKYSLKTPILIKLSPDLSDEELEEIILATKNFSIQGIIATNSSNEFQKLGIKFQKNRGGLSGKPLQERSNMIIRVLFKELGKNLPIIGVGGIFNGNDAYKKIKAGASLVQIYTSLIYEGPSIIKKIKGELAQLLEEDGFKEISEAVGIDNL